MIPALRARPGIAAWPALCLALTAGSVEACRCAEMSRAALLDGASMVFVGRILSVEQTGDVERVLEAEVEERFKGGTAERVRFLTTGTCAYAAEPGERHLLYLFDVDGIGLRTSICDGNMRAAEAEGVLRGLTPLTD